MGCFRGYVCWITADIHNEYIAVVITGIQMNYTIKIGFDHSNLILFVVNIVSYGSSVQSTVP